MALHKWINAWLLVKFHANELNADIWTKLLMKMLILNRNLRATNYITINFAI